MVAPVRLGHRDRLATIGLAQLGVGVVPSDRVRVRVRVWVRDRLRVRVRLRLRLR